MFRCAYTYVLYIGLPILALIAWWHWYYYRKPIYRFPHALLFQKTTQKAPRLSPWVLLFCVRLCALALLLFALARPQNYDIKSPISVEGIDIMMVLDVSGSMEMFDDLQDRRSRFSVAQEEAIKFITKRDNDPIGLILFGATAVTRCPLTLDKRLLTGIITDTKIGVINPDGTMLLQAIAMGAHRLRTSPARSKIMIVLTDGAPSAGDLEPKIALELVKKYGIKVYTIGIGSQRGGYVQHQFFGLVSMPTPINKQLLTMIAETTGGQFFEAKNPQDVSRIYQLIDSLERTEHTAPQYTNVHELFMYAVWLVLLLLTIEIVLSLKWRLL